MVEKKLCRKCLKDKPESEFHRAGQRKDGSWRMQSLCKVCDLARQKEAYASTHEIKRVFHHGLTKVCKTCGVEKSLDEFYLTTYAKKAKKPGTESRMTYCKPCYNEKGRKWSRENPEYHKSITKAWVARKKENPEEWAVWRRRVLLKSTYGMTPEQWDDLYREQRGACAICRLSLDDELAKPCVDHDHATGVVRGLLCNPCNWGLGQFDDDPSRLRMAAEYLEKSRLKKGLESRGVRR